MIIWVTKVLRFGEEIENKGIIHLIFQKPISPKKR